MGRFKSVPNPIGWEGDGFNPPVVFCLPFPQKTSDQPKTFQLFIYTIDTSFDEKNFHRIPGKSHDRSSVRNIFTETDVLQRDFSDVILFCILQLTFDFK